MPTINEKFSIQTKGFTDIVDITQRILDSVYKHEIKNGTVVVYTSGSTVGITTIEYEPGLLKDLPEALDKIAPEAHEYHHDETWHDGNGYAHVRSAMIGNSVIIPLIDGALDLGTWQQVVLMDFDNKARTRCITIQIIH